MCDTQHTWKMFFLNVFEIREVLNFSWKWKFMKRVFYNFCQSIKVSLLLLYIVRSKQNKCMNGWQGTTEACRRRRRPLPVACLSLDHLFPVPVDYMSLFTTSLVLYHISTYHHLFHWMFSLSATDNIMHHGQCGRRDTDQ